MSILDQIEENMETKAKKSVTTVEPKAIPDFESDAPVTPPPVAELPNPEDLSPVHPLNRPEDIPEAPAPRIVNGFVQKDEDPAETLYKYIQNNFEEFIPNYEKGFIPVARPHPNGWEIFWKYAPDYAESTLMAYYDKGKTATEEDFKKKIDEMIVDFVEERDQTKLRRFVEVVDYDPDACRGILERDSHFLSEIAEMDVVDFNLKYFQLRTIRKMEQHLENMLKIMVSDL